MHIPTGTALQLVVLRLQLQLHRKILSLLEPASQQFYFSLYKLRNVGTIERKKNMAILAHLVATSHSEKKVCSHELIAFINELFNAGVCALPAAILVGQARSLPYYWGDSNDSSITPNAPGFMLSMEDTDFPQDLIWYYGTDKIAFQVAISQALCEKRDCCMSFPHGWNGWDGAVIYALEQPFLLNLRGARNVAIHRYVTCCFTLFSMIGGGGEVLNTSLQTILANYFGADFLLEEVIDC